MTRRHFPCPSFPSSSLLSYSVIRHIYIYIYIYIYDMSGPAELAFYDVILYAIHLATHERTSVVSMMSCHLIPQIRHRHCVWKLSHFFRYDLAESKSHNRRRELTKQQLYRLIVCCLN